MPRHRSRPRRRLTDALEYLLYGAATLVALIYLLYALLRPDRFYQQENPVEAHMNPSLAPDLADILGKSNPREELACEAPLLVAARMVSHAADYEMTATTVVGVLGRDDVGAFKALVAEICDEYGVDAHVSLHGGSFSVRFTHQAIEPAAPPSQPTGLKSMLARLARRGIQAR